MNRAELEANAVVYYASRKGWQTNRALGEPVKIVNVEPYAGAGATVRRVGSGPGVHVEFLTRPGRGVVQLGYLRGPFEEVSARVEEAQRRAENPPAYERDLNEVTGRAQKIGVTATAHRDESGAWQVLVDPDALAGLLDCAEKTGWRHGT